MPVVRILMTLFTGTSDIVPAILVVLYMAGLFMMFPKSGVKNWHALIPGLREYQLARCAGCESDAPKLALINLAMIALSIGYRIFRGPSISAEQPAKYSAPPTMGMDSITLDASIQYR